MEIVRPTFGQLYIGLFPVAFPLTLVAIHPYTLNTLLPPQCFLLLPVHSLLQLPALLATVLC